MEMQLKRILNSCRPYIENGKVASYIPELAKADTSKFGICLVQKDGKEQCAGDFSSANGYTEDQRTRYNIAPHNPPTFHKQQPQVHHGCSFPA